MKIYSIFFLLLIVIPLVHAETSIIHHDGKIETVIIGEYLNSSKTYNFKNDINNVKTINHYPAVEGFYLEQEKHESLEFANYFSFSTQTYLLFYSGPKLVESYYKAVQQDIASQLFQKTVKINISKEGNTITIIPQQAGFAAFQVEFESSNITYQPFAADAQIIILGYYAGEDSAHIGINPAFKGIDGIINTSNLTYMKIISTDQIDMHSVEIPASISISKSIVQKPILWTLLILLFSSSISSMISASIAFKGTRPKLWQFAVYGLYNSLTLPVFWLLSNFKRVDQEFVENPDPEVQEVKLDRWKRWLIGMPIFLLCVIAVLLPLSLVLGLEEVYSRIFLQPNFIYYISPLLIFTPLILWGLFKGRKSLIYNVIFSVAFVFISGAIVFALKNL